MHAKPLKDRLDSPEVLAWHLARLLEIDPRLQRVSALAGPLEIRRTTPGFAGLARIICGQQLSVASANAIWSRFEKLEGATDQQAYLMLEESAVRATGFSSGKYRTLRAVAEAQLDFAHLDQLPGDEMIKNLIYVNGIGPWTAGIYLMFCAAHPDVFPAGDLALQKAAGHAFEMEKGPDAKHLAEISRLWAPHRATAALLFWRYYSSVVRQKEGIAA